MKEQRTIREDTILCTTICVYLREGWQWKSSVERSGAEIVAYSPTEFTKICLVPRNVLNEGTPK